MVQIKSEFSGVYVQEIVCIPHYKVGIKLRVGATPIYNERQIPYALLYALEQEGIITKIANSDCGSPLVVIPKSEEINNSLVMNLVTPNSLLSWICTNRTCTYLCTNSQV